ncbi:MAG: RNA polymerase sigma factor [Bacteroidales bacterium]|nr:RNA polymerase sigma factor [Bacteroidales bacterium]
MTDKDIIKLHREGRFEEAFDALVKAYSERLYWHLRHFTASHDDADDLLQEVFIKVWTQFASFRGESALFTWLWRIASNEAISWLRKKKVRAALEFDSIENVLSLRVQDDPWFDGDEAERKLQQAIATLSGKEKEVFLLRYYEDMPYEQMASVLDSTVGSLKVLYHNAVTKVKKVLDKES